MTKLLRSSIASIALGWAWKNRSMILSKLEGLRSTNPPSNPPTGYGNALGEDALINPATGQ